MIKWIYTDLHISHENPIWWAQKIIRHDRPPLVLEGTPEPMGGVVEGCDVCQSAT